MFFGMGLWAYAEVPIDKSLTITKLRQYCQACHGVDNLRFLDSEDDEAVWKTIYSEKAPNSKKLWVNAIIEVLNWPTNTPPPFQQPISAGKDWMPKGYKRIALAKDQQGGFSTRNIIIETLKYYQLREE